MTCREKLIADHPELTKEEIDYHTRNYCPSDYGYMDDPETTEGDSSCYYVKCMDCWDREIPETEPSESDEETNDELVKRIADLEQRNKNQSDLIEKKTVELTIAHARIAELTGDLEEANKNKKEQLEVINELTAKCNNVEKELNDAKERIESLEYQYTCLVSKYMAQGLENNVTESGTSCAQSPNDICHAIALSMFNKYHALLDVGFSNDEALKLTVMWKD